VVGPRADHPALYRATHREEARVPPSTVFWVIVPPVVIIVLTFIFFIRSKKRS